MMAYSKKEIVTVFNKILKRIEEGEALRVVLKDDKMPSSQTFYKWIEEDSDKSKQYARACETRYDLIFDEILTIADKQDADISIDENGKECINHNAIGRSRLQVDARKWALSKMNPKKYGDKVDITTDGEKINTPLNITQEVKNDLDKLNDKLSG